MLKNKLRSVDAIIQGLKDGGCVSCFNFPGFKSHLIFEGLGGKSMSINERNAYDMAYGSSLGGQRTVVTFKNVGLNVASDSFLNSIISGVSAGLVVIVTDDTHVSDSQSLMDSRHYIEFYGGLWFEPATNQQAYDFCRNSFQLSEKLDVPVVIRLTSDFFALKEGYSRKTPLKLKIQSLIHNPKKFIIHPVFWKNQINNLEQKNKRIRSFVEKIHILPKKKNKNGLISFGPNYESSKKLDIFSIATYPLPLGKIKNFIQSHKRISVIEHGDEYALNKIKGLMSTTRINKIEPSYPNLSSTYRTWSGLEKLFMAIKKSKPEFVVSDLTQFTNESTQVIDSCLCLGSSAGVASGLAHSGISPICMSGDASFLHGSLDALYECLSRKLKINLIIVENGGSWCTGGQKTVLDIAEVLKKLPLKFETVNYSNTSQKKFEFLIDQMIKNSKSQILLVEYNSK